MKTALELLGIAQGAVATATVGTGGRDHRIASDIHRAVQPGPLMDALYGLASVRDSSHATSAALLSLLDVVTRLVHDNERRCFEHPDCRENPDLGRACWDKQQETGVAGVSPAGTGVAGVSPAGTGVAGVSPAGTGVTVLRCQAKATSPVSGLPFECQGASGHADIHRCAGWTWAEGEEPVDALQGSRGG